MTKKYIRPANSCPTDARRERSSGLTLIEVLVAGAILSIMAIVGIPNLQQFIRNANINSQAHEFMSTLMYARSEAIKRGQRVTVCRSTNGSTCVGTPSTVSGSTATGNWHEGWIVFVDANDNNTRQAGVAEPLLRVRPGPLDANMTFISDTHFATHISYLNNGALARTVLIGTTTPVVASGTIRLCHPRHARGINIVVIPTGRARSEGATCAT